LIVEDAQHLREEQAAENAEGAFEGSPSDDGETAGGESDGSEASPDDAGATPTAGSEGSEADETGTEDESRADADDDQQSGLSDFL
jgi:hypothetical protein